MDKSEVINEFNKLIAKKKAKLQVLTEVFEHQENSNYPSTAVTQIEIKEYSSDIIALEKLRDSLRELWGI